VILRVLVDELLVIGDNGLGDRLTDGVNLRSVTTTSDADANVDARKLLEANEEKRLIDLEAKDIGLDKMEGMSVHLDKTFASLAVGNCSSGLLLAEALDRLNRSVASHFGC